MRGELGFFDVDERLKELSAKADDLERLNADTGYGGLLSVHLRARLRTGRRGGDPHRLQRCLGVRAPLGACGNQPKSHRAED
jgi:hypothetical protein